MAENTSEQSVVYQHQKALSQCLKGKPTEGVLMRFNEQEFYLLNLASRVAAKKGFSSRQAWMRHVILNAVREELAQDDALHPFVSVLENP
ncbi:hypothetical protein [Vreelandella massiliensis]|uniref:hypothetical protein n=1 Tax=Vreelandella massiliensis TaxID=1816686 RepID=UPI00096A7F53|nr:hypothetical protein [Halomonas massiliensis]